MKVRLKTISGTHLGFPGEEYRDGINPDPCSFFYPQLIINTVCTILNSKRLIMYHIKTIDYGTPELLNITGI